MMSRKRDLLPFKKTSRNENVLLLYLVTKPLIDTLDGKPEAGGGGDWIKHSKINKKTKSPISSAGNQAKHNI